MEKLQLKEFSLINPKLKASLVFQAIEAVIRPEMIEKALKESNSFESTSKKAHIKFSSVLSYCDECSANAQIVVLRRLEGLRLRVIGFNDDSFKEFSQWIK